MNEEEVLRELLSKVRDGEDLLFEAVDSALDSDDLEKAIMIIAGFATALNARIGALDQAVNTLRRE